MAHGLEQEHAVAGARAAVTVDLPSGRLSVWPDPGPWSLDRVCAFAARRNPRRGFLFVSRVLGRHLPVAPAEMVAAWAALADGLPDDLPGPVLFVGLAETAVALGQGVHAAWRRRTGREDALFLHSTRYRLDRPPALTFAEEHSHAARHWLYAPEEPRAARLFEAARSLVLVDDEASTGATFHNLALALMARLPGIVQVASAVLTDWSGGAAAARLAAALPLVATTALLTGRYRFEPRPGWQPPAMPDVTGGGSDASALLPRNWGRLGRIEPPEPPALWLERLRPRAGERLLVLGSGEFVYLPARLAALAAGAGARAATQATTRSPILPGHAIGASLAFTDNYGEGIANFLYNVRRADWDRIVLCVETPADRVDPALTGALDALVLSAWEAAP